MKKIKEIILREIEEKRNIPLLAKLSNKIFKLSDILFNSLYRKSLKTTDITIISNNCWGGVLYEHFGLQKCSPTVGAYFFADDYIKFVTDLEHYLSLPLTFISCVESKYHDILTLKKQNNVPIGCLGDVEIVFLHYKTEKEALEKWNRRLERVNKNNLIIKFSEQNLCTTEHLRAFNNLPITKKLLFTKKKYENINSIVLPFYSKKVSLLSDIHEYRFAMKEIIKVINS